MKVDCSGSRIDDEVFVALVEEIFVALFPGSIFCSIVNVQCSSAQCSVLVVFL